MGVLTHFRVILWSKMKASGANYQPKLRVRVSSIPHAWGGGKGRGEVIGLQQVRKNISRTHCGTFAILLRGDFCYM